MDGIAELRCGRISGVVGTGIRVVGAFAVGSPMALVLPRIRIEDDDAMVGVAIGHI